MDALHLAIGIAVGVLGLAATLFGFGKGYGMLMGELREVKHDGKETARLMGAMFKSVDRLKGSVADIRLAHAELSGRIDTWERVAGLPALYRRTQPLPRARDETGKPEEVFTDGWTPEGPDK